MKAAAPTFSVVNSSPYCTFASCMKVFTFSFVMLLQRVQFSRLSALAVFSKSWSFMATETVPCWTCSTAGSEEQAAALMCSVREGGGVVSLRLGTADNSMPSTGSQAQTAAWCNVSVQTCFRLGTKLTNKSQHSNLLRKLFHIVQCQELWENSLLG